MQTSPLVNNAVRLIPNLVLALVSLTFGLGVIEIVLRSNPRLVPADIPTYPPARRFTPNQDEWLDMRKSDGDLFTRIQGRVQPIAPADDELLARVHLVTDRLGFRNSEPWRTRYDIIALGDSFTYGTAAPVAWPERLGQLTNKSVLNLGWEGIGPMEERDLFFEHGRDRSPQWVIAAYFEGNDLNDAGSYSKADPFLLPRIPKFYLKQMARTFGLIGNGTASQPVAKAAPSEYDYPVRIRMATSELDIVLFDFYLSWLSANATDIAASRNLGLTAEAFRNIETGLARDDARVLIVYVPSKERLVAADLDAPTRRRVFRTVRVVHPDKDGYLTQGNESVEPGNVIAHLDDQADAIAELARQQGVDFLDLTPCFRVRMEQGGHPYYEYDTHWNQEGHDLAAKLIANWIANRKETCPTP